MDGNALLSLLSFFFTHLFLCFLRKMSLEQLEWFLNKKVSTECSTDTKQGQQTNTQR